jgi:hypothetical protein
MFSLFGNSVMIRLLAKIMAKSAFSRLSVKGMIMKELFSTIFTFVVLSSLVLAQSGGTFNIEKSVIAGGGGQSSGGTFDLTATIGQPLAGTTSSGGTFTVNSGFWQLAPITIAGTVNYGNVLSGPPRFVSNVQINGAGSPAVMSVTGPPGATAGQYTLAGFGSGAYTVTPSKMGGVNGAISSFDAGLIALHVAGPPNPQLNPTQLMVADVSGNGAVTSFDAGMIAKFVAGPPFAAPGIGSTSTWRFTPVNRNYATVTTNLAGEDYTGFLMGEVSGNWMNTGARSESVGGPEKAIALTLPQIATPADKQIVIPVNVEGIAGKGVISYEFNIKYDPSVLQPLETPVDTAETASRALKVVTNSHQPGVLRVVVYGSQAIDRDGVLLNLRFSAVGTAGSVSPLVFENLMLNDGLAVIATDGRVEVSD